MADVRDDGVPTTLAKVAEAFGTRGLAVATVVLAPQFDAGIESEGVAEHGDSSRGCGIRGV
jgi:hypothetical protein